MRIAVAYCRVSTKNQESALIDHQEQWKEIFEKEELKFAKCGVFYKKNGYKEAKNGLYVDEGISAKEYKKHRKAFQQMIEDASNGLFKQILVEDTTRFARSVEDGMKIVKDLRAKGVDIYFRKENIHSTDINKDMFLSIYFTIAESEIKVDSNRIKWKQEKLHKAGKWTSPPPYGYDINKGELSKNEKEAAIVDLIFYLYNEILLGMRAIANYLNEKGFRTKKNKLWKSTSIKYILTNRMYIGDVVNHKTESVDITRGTNRKIPEEEQIVVHKEELRIIDNETWNKKEEILKKRNEKLKNREGHSSKHLLSALMYCEQCGSVYIREKLQTKKRLDEKGNKVDTKYGWICQGHNHYGNFKCKGRFVLWEDELLEFIKQELREEKEANSNNFLLYYTEKKREEINKIDIEKIKEKHKDIDMQMYEIRREKNKKLISEETFEQQIKYLNEELKQVRVLEETYDSLKADIEHAEARYVARCEMLKNLDVDKLTNATLKQIFNKIKIMAKYENGYKKIAIHFSYNIIDDTKEELLRENIDGESSITEYYKPYKLEKIRKSTKTRYFDNK